MSIFAAPSAAFTMAANAGPTSIVGQATAAAPSAVLRKATCLSGKLSSSQKRSYTFLLGCTDPAPA